MLFDTYHMWETGIAYQASLISFEKQEMLTRFEIIASKQTLTIVR